MRLLASRRAIVALLLVTVLISAPGVPVASEAAERSVPAAPAAAPTELTAGTNAIVRADGDCLRIREKPGLSARSLTCLPEGAVVEVLEGRQLADGYYWQKVKSGSISGWAAEMYLQPGGATSAAAPCPAATAPQPVAIAYHIIRAWVEDGVEFG